MMSAKFSDMFYNRLAVSPAALFPRGSSDYVMCFLLPLHLFERLSRAITYCTGGCPITSRTYLWSTFDLLNSGHVENVTDMQILPDLKLTQQNWADMRNIHYCVKNREDIGCCWLGPFQCGDVY